MRKQVGNISFWYVKPELEQNPEPILNLNLWYLDPENSVLDIGIMFPNKKNGKEEIYILFPQKISEQNIEDLALKCRDNNLCHLIFNEPCKIIMDDAIPNHFHVDTEERSICFVKITSKVVTISQQEHTLLQISYNTQGYEPSQKPKSYNYIRLRFNMVNSDSNNPFIYTTKKPSLLNGTFHKSYCIDIRINDIRSDLKIQDHIEGCERIKFKDLHLIIANQSSHELVSYNNDTDDQLKIRVSEPGWEDYQPKIDTSITYLVYHFKTKKNMFFAKFKTLSYNNLVVVLVTMFLFVYINIVSTGLYAFIDKNISIKSNNLYLLLFIAGIIMFVLSKEWLHMQLRKFKDWSCKK